MRDFSITKQIAIISLLLLIISFIIPFFTDAGFTLVSIINSMFIVGMIAFLISSFLLILKVGFFDAITHSFRTFFKTFSKQGQLLGDDLDQMAMPSEYEYSFAKPLIIASLIIIVIMIIFLVIYYL
ncbi:DUF3899 domain-containing protein [Bacillus suaedaesalsae]|uniref:DUF3899 domain-containing protein n=1 Tax=Bacillus suaedaesalsae TaxID=2810349 RepID=A0ABS2DLC6_9BACI|nr:DUF3899 domain-containing protein [Bacillus suaedaesalsae]MBM6618283.1 DUF3899 domain-containing protein [Bacillus suaedaesalsae]